VRLFGTMQLRSWFWRGPHLLACLLFAVPLLALSLDSAFALQSGPAPSEWSTPSVIFRTDGYATRPRVVADAAGDLHLLFFLREASQGGAAGATMIMYSRFQDGAWSSPVDVLVGAGTNTPSVTVDARGVLHVVWEGGTQGELAYSQAHVSQAGTARGWSRPRLLSEPNTFDSDILATEDGILRLVYSTKSGYVWYQESVDGGASWSTPITVAEPETPGCTTNHPRVAVDSGGGIHVVWTELQLPSGWPPCGAIYSDSLDRGRTWSTPVRIAGPGYGQINLLANGSSTLLLAWNAMVGIGERKFTRSIDGGFGWQPAQHLSTRLRGGFTGIPSMAADSAGVVHLVTAVDRPLGESMAVYHMAWNGTTWSEPVLVSVGAIGFRSVELPWIVVTNGNRLHVVYEDDFQRIWHTSRAVPAPPIPPLPIPASDRTETASRTADGTPTAQPVPARRDLSELQEIAQAPGPAQNSFLTMLAPVGIIVGLVIAGRLVQRFWQ
jgi:hypothetical protein